MDTSKKFFNIAMGISLIIASLSLLISTTRANKAMAQPAAAAPAALPNGVLLAGSVFVVSGMSGTSYVLGYDPKTSQVSVLGKISYKDMKE